MPITALFIVFFVVWLLSQKRYIRDTAAADIAVLAACMGSAVVFSAAQGAVALLIVPVLSSLGISSRAGVHAVIAAASVLGSLTAAAILCLPVGWLGRRQPVVSGAIVGVVGSTMVALISPPLPATDSVFFGMPWLEIAVFVGGCVLFSAIGAFGARRVAA